jgi:hypothetical protein
MDRTGLTSIEKQTLKEHADRMMDKWVALRENLKVCTVPGNFGVLCSICIETSRQLTSVSFQEADSSTVSRFCLYLQILALSLYPDYTAEEARELLARDETSMLRTFFEKDDGPDPESIDPAQADHIVALAHGLLEASGGKKSAFWDQFDNRYSAFKNQSICGFMVDATSMDSPKEAHAEQLYHAILKSKLLPENKTFSFTMFLDIIQKCQDVIDPGGRCGAFRA